MDLATKVAELQFRNPDFVLMFRGQSTDYLNSKGNSTIKASLFRASKHFVHNPKKTIHDPDNTPYLPSIATLKERYQTLEKAEFFLVTHYESEKFLGLQRLKRHRILRWAILQHYEVCCTPLLDVTHSLRIAASFASNTAKDEAFIYVMGVPNLSGAITASAEAGIQIVRIASVCPPSALRPHIQEGYLLGEYPDMVSYDQKELYGHYEMDFARRLVAKFRFNPSTFWHASAFPKVPRKALYPPTDNDPLRKVAWNILQDLKRS